MKKIFLVLAILIAVNTMRSQNTAQSAEQLSASMTASGEQKAEKGDWNGAVNDYTSAIQQNKKNALAYFDRAKALYNLKDYRAAFVDYTKSINADAGNNSSFVPYAYFGRGMCLYTMGTKDKACLEFTKANEMGCSEALEALQNFCN